MIRVTAPDDLRLDDAFVRRVERLRLPLRRLGQGVGARPGARRRPAADFTDHRPYAPGDDVRHIDWAHLARHDAVTVKLGPDTHAADVRLLLDLSASMAADAAKWRLARELVAALGWLALAAGDRLGLTVLGGDGAWGPSSGAGARGAWLSHVARLAPGGRTSALGPVLRRAIRAAPWGGTLFVLSDLWLADDLDAALARAPAPRWDVRVVHLLARAELEPVREGAARLVDVETGETLDLILDAAARAAYRAALAAHLDAVRDACAARGAAWSLAPGDAPFEAVLAPLLAPAARRR